ncbi:type I 3-dehydroquinate dehydratase [Georgenia sp. M64]|uniref:type I 3-dehydroquinate dehydratase n=1 Tax=Georgenia sp. M64 TaxID=3120520 RepID=UPI0030E52048
MRTVRLKNVVLGEDPTKVIVPLTGADAASLVDEVRAVRAVRAGPDGHDASSVVDVVEWRADHLARGVGPDGPAADGPAADGPAADRPAADARVADALVPDVLAAGRMIAAEAGDLPVLFTFRTAAEGGAAAIADEDYADLTIAVARSGLVDAVDVELFRDERQVRRVVAAAHEAGVAVVMSTHDFAGTPATQEILDRLERMVELGADVAKLAATPRDAGDVLTLLDATWTMSRRTDRPLITMAMGRVGVASRLVGGVFGSAATFGSVGAASAPGQVPVGELNRVLRLLG